MQKTIINEVKAEEEALRKKKNYNFLIQLNFRGHLTIKKNSNFLAQVFKKINKK